MFTEQSLRQYPAVVKGFTGLPSEAFWEMMTALEQAGIVPLVLGSTLDIAHRLYLP